MTIDSPTRPKEVLIAVLLAIGALIVDVSAVVATVVAWNASYGEGWLLVLFTRIFIITVYGVFIAFAYHGRGWVRYAYLAGLISGVGLRYAVADIGMWLNPFLFLSLTLSVLALVFWFLPKTNQWYQEQGRSRVEKRAVEAEFE